MKLQDVCNLFIVALFFLGLSFLRFIGLVVSMKGEMSMKLTKAKVAIYFASLLETLWAMLVSYVVGTSLSPIAHKLLFVVDVIDKEHCYLAP